MGRLAETEHSGLLFRLGPIPSQWTFTGADCPAPDPRTFGL
jgi:hypothetical protein